MSQHRKCCASFKGNGPNGRHLCFCGCGREVVRPRLNWFSDECVRAWQAINDPAVIRRNIEKRDHCICAKCGRDTNAIRAAYISDLMAHYRATVPVGQQHQWIHEETVERIDIHGRPKPPTGFYDLSRSWWEADHILPVCEGGGQCGLENYRTLCVPCHKEETRELAKRRAARRKQEKEAKQLQLA